MSYSDEEDVHKRVEKDDEEEPDESESRKREECWCGGSECGWSCGGCEEGGGRVQGCGTSRTERK